MVSPYGTYGAEPGITYSGCKRYPQVQPPGLSSPSSLRGAALVRDSRTPRMEQNATINTASWGLWSLRATGRDPKVVFEIIGTP